MKIFLLAAMTFTNCMLCMDFSYRQRDSQQLNQYRARVDLVVAQRTGNRAPQNCTTNGSFNTRIEATHHNAHLPLQKKQAKKSAGTEEFKKKKKKKKKSKK